MKQKVILNASRILDLHTLGSPINTLIFEHSNSIDFTEKNS